jgi:riboflavin kinase/FMN adenylyltransferase
MRIVHDISELERGRPAIITIGSFDGVHRGHQYLIRNVVDRARTLDFDSVVMTFDPRPVVVLRPGSLQLTGAEEKARVIGAVGPDVLIVMPFSRETSQVPAQEFLGRLLEHVNMAELWTGSDFAFGHNRQGTVDFLIAAGQATGFAVHVVARRQLHGEQLSSTRARELVAAGDVRTAAIVLGHYATVAGRVVHGAHRGRELGYPTANVEPPPYQMLPPTGIYAGHLHVDGNPLPAAISVGTNPTFGGSEVGVEAYVLDFSGDLYGQQVLVDFVERIREEQTFASVEELLAEMERDVESVRGILQDAVEPGELLLPQ